VTADGRIELTCGSGSQSGDATSREDSMSEENGTEPKPKANITVRPPGPRPLEISLPNEFLEGPVTDGQTYRLVRVGPNAFDLVSEAVLPRKVTPEAVTDALERSHSTAPSWKP